MIYFELPIPLQKKPTQAVFISNQNQTLPFYQRVKPTALLIGILSLSLLTIMYFFSGSSLSETPEEPSTKDLKIEVQLPSNPIMSLIADDAIQNETNWKYIKVKKGQTLSSIFDDLNLSQSLLYKIINSDEDAKKLTKIYPGASIGFAKDKQGKFEQLTYNLSETEELLIKQKDALITSEIIQHPTETNLQSSHGIITGSLFNAGKAAGLTDNMVMQLANIFAWDIDFILDIRSGDSFSLIYEKIYQNGEFLRDGNILAASFTNQGETYKAVAFDDGKGISFYNPEGRNMKKAFLRAPLNFSYISSNFNPKRFHPVQKRVKAHRGIDYAAPRGTPIFAAGDGTVTRSSYNKYNGNHIFIKHPSGIVTKYLHLTKRYVKRGQRVKQGKTIGTLGSTGMVTGPHLHYEFVLNGVHRNPRTVKLPKASPLRKSKMPEFKSFAQPILSQLDSINSDIKNIAQTKTVKTKNS